MKELKHNLQTDQQKNDEFETETLSTSFSSFNTYFLLKTQNHKIITEKTFIQLISFLYGLGRMFSLGSFYYQKDHLNMNSFQMQIMHGVIYFPTCMKPLLGFLFDQLRQKVHYIKYIILFVNISYILIMHILATQKVNVYQFYLLIFTLECMRTMESLSCEYILVKSTQKESVNSKNNEKSNHLPIYFGFKTTGVILATFYGGRILQLYSIQYLFYLCQFFPMISILFCFLFQEEKREIYQKMTIQKEMKILYNFLTQKQVKKLLLFLFLINFKPDFDQIITFYLTEQLNFTPKMISNLQTSVYVIFILGIILYYFYFLKKQPINFLFLTTFIQILANLSFLSLLSNLIQKMNWNSQYFCLFNIGLNTLIQDINILPITTIWCQICPFNLEATAIAILSGFNHFTSILSNFMGGLIQQILQITEQHYSQLWILITIQTTYCFFVLFLLLLIGLPDPSEELKNQEIIDKKMEIKELDQQIQQLKVVKNFHQ